jgi:hypothetical protein
VATAAYAAVLVVFVSGNLGQWEAQKKMAWLSAKKACLEQLAREKEERTARKLAQQQV